ncbi:MAG TPA: Clp protease ClpP [Desulfitobacterium dehalogenans]|uniref:ATP-dependent Clp protease proteolytic subunit n=1 Tax=Desulfitobacterium dehalogenans TaxID=36854 RepID=A0A7C6Z5Z9_9FIRM|nr:Clp protease ClpP [Desulfitobacterium dehalogenans]
MKPETLKFNFKQNLEKPDTLELYIYSEVVSDGWDWWTGKKIESETSADYFRKKLNEYKDVKYINLYINSCGGSVVEGYGIYAQLKRHEAYKTVYVDGFANSIASIIAMCGDKIIMYINAVMGIHNMMDWCMGNAAEHRKCADNLDSMMEGNRQIYFQRSKGKITLEKLTELLDAETILTAQECFEYGLCDEIAEIAADPEQVTQAMQRMNTNMAAQIKYFQNLKQSFGEAMSVLKEQGSYPGYEPTQSGPEPLLEPPKENKTQKFLAALFR